MWCFFFFFSSRRRHTRFDCDWSSDVCSSDLVIAGKHRRIGKESDRKWEEGDDFESTLEFETIEYTPNGEKVVPNSMTKADERLIRQIKEAGIRKLIRFGCGEKILAKICKREPVHFETLHSYK